MLKKNVLTLMLFCLIVPPAVYTQTLDYTTFLAGTILIDENTKLNSSQKSLEFLKLKKITGVNEEQAVEFVRQYKNHPEEWKSIIELVMTKITGINETKKLK